MCQLLARSDLSEEQQELVTGAQSAVEMLQQIVNDILDFSKLEAGKLDLHISSFDIVEEMEHIVNFMSPIGL